MAQHLTPTELARELGMARRDVIDRCVTLGVPIYQGRIDRGLFCAALHARDRAPQTEPEDPYAEWETPGRGRRASRAI